MARITENTQYVTQATHLKQGEILEIDAHSFGERDSIRNSIYAIIRRRGYKLSVKVDGLKIVIYPARTPESFKPRATIVDTTTRMPVELAFPDAIRNQEDIDFARYQERVDRMRKAQDDVESDCMPNLDAGMQTLRLGNEVLRYNRPEDPMIRLKKEMEEMKSERPEVVESQTEGEK